MPEYHGKGIAKTILNKLENWVKEEKDSVSILETGFLQKDTIHLYKKVAYEVTENLEQYIGVENSICVKKRIIFLYFINQKSLIFNQKS